MFWPEPPTPLSQGAPTIKLDNATFTGTAAGIVDQFLGIPFAKPPIGDLRFRPPQPVEPYTGEYDAAQYGFSCPQMIPEVAIPERLSMAAIGYTKVIHAALPDSEDCSPDYFVSGVVLIEEPRLDFGYREAGWWGFGV
jgi:hypothetical protein